MRRTMEDPRNPNSDGPGRGDTCNANTGAPRWVRIFGLVFLVALVLFIVLHFAGGGFEGHPPPVT